MAVVEKTMAFGSKGRFLFVRLATRNVSTKIILGFKRYYLLQTLYFGVVQPTNSTTCSFKTLQWTISLTQFRVLCPSRGVQKHSTRVFTRICGSLNILYSSDLPSIYQPSVSTKTASTFVNTALDARFTNI